LWCEMIVGRNNRHPPISQGKPFLKAVKKYYKVLSAKSTQLQCSNIACLTKKGEKI
jgi:hypothetical protein